MNMLTNVQRQTHFLFYFMEGWNGSAQKTVMNWEAGHAKEGIARHEQILKMRRS